MDKQLLKTLGLKWSHFIPEEITPTDKQVAFMMLPHREAMYGGAAGSGKILAKDGVVLTPFGFKKNKDLRVGDRINNPDGTTQRIIQLRPWVKLEKWTVHFHDGTSTEVAADHLWLAWRSGKRKKLPNGKECFGEESAEVIETRELKQWLDTAIEQEKRGQRPNWPLIPVCKEQVFNVTLRYQSDIDPYILGMWLGDGHWSDNGGIGITSKDAKHMGKVLKDYSYTHVAPYCYNLTKDSAKKTKATLTRLKLNGTKADTKFIPREFLMGNIETRYAILQGLLDTDGTVDQQGHVSFCSVSKQLANDVAFLVRSLGGTATVTTKPKPFYRDSNGKKVYGKKAYILYIKHPNEQKLFRLVRKKKRCKESNELLNKSVVRIEVGGEIHGRCLTVSNPNGLYITNDFIVTHNSIVLAILALQYADVPGYNGIIFRRTLTEANLAGSVMDILLTWLLPRTGKGGDVKFDANYNTFYFLEYGSQLTIAYLRSEIDHERYKGTSFHNIFFDELTDFAEDQFRFLNRSLRRSLQGPAAKIPLRIRSATNPGGLGHVWVKNRYKINKCEGKCDHEVDYKFRGHDPERPFIQATLKDNPYIDQSSYTLALNEMGEIDRMRMKEGNWDVSAGARFKAEYFINRWRINGAYFYCQQIERTWHRSGCEIFITMDVAASTKTGVANTNFRVQQERSYTVMSVWAKTPDNYLLWLDQIRIQAEIPDILAMLTKVCKMHKPSKVIVDAQGIGKGVAQMASFNGIPVDEVPTTSDKIQNSATAQTRAKRGKVILPETAPWLDILTGELFTWTGHPHETDDQIDALSNAALYVQSQVMFGEREYDTQPPSLPTTMGEGWNNGYANDSYFPVTPDFSGGETADFFGN